MERYRTVQEVAELLRVSPRTVYDALRDGRLEAFRPMGRWLISDDDIRNFVKRGRTRQRAASTPPPAPPTVPPVQTAPPAQEAPKSNPLANRKNKRR